MIAKVSVQFSLISTSTMCLWDYCGLPLCYSTHIMDLKVYLSLQTITMKQAFTVKISIILFIYIQAHILCTCYIFLLWFVDVFMVVQRKLKTCLYYVVHSRCASTHALNRGTLVLRRHVLVIKRMSFNCAYFLVVLTVCVQHVRKGTTKFYSPLLWSDSWDDVILRSVVTEVK